VEHSTRELLKDRLTTNMEQHQTAIDLAFPTNEPRFVVANAVFLNILRRGYRQAIAMLDLISPFNILMTSAGVRKASAWDKICTYLKAIVNRITKVRTISTDLTPEAMLFCMMKATKLLDQFSHHDWIWHPDVSAAMIIAAMQRDSKLIADAIATLKKEETLFATKEDGVKVEKVIAELKRKNPNWNT